MLCPACACPRAAGQSTASGGLKTTAVYSLTALEAASLQSRCWQDHVLWKVPEENLPHAFPLAPVILGSQLHTPISASVVT